MNAAMRAAMRTLMCAAAVVGLATGCGAAGAARPLHGTAYDPPAAAPPLRLPDARGGTFDLARATADSGRAALVLFGYTRCPDVCPTTLANWVRVKRALGGDADRVRFVFVTVDPERDAAPAVRRYVDQFDSTFVGLAPSRAAADAAQRAWHVASYAAPAAPAAAGPHAGGHAVVHAVVHATQLFAVDAAGRLRAHYAPGARPADVAADLRRLLD